MNKVFRIVSYRSKHSVLVHIYSLQTHEDRFYQASPILTISSLNGQLSLGKLKINEIYGSKKLL